MKRATWNNFLGYDLVFQGLLNETCNNLISLRFSSHRLLNETCNVEQLHLVMIQVSRAFKWNSKRETTSSVYDLDLTGFWMKLATWNNFLGYDLVFTSCWMELVTWNNFLKLWFSFSRTFEWNSQRETTPSGYGCDNWEFDERKIVNNNIHDCTSTLNKIIF